MLRIHVVLVASCWSTASASSGARHGVFVGLNPTARQRAETQGASLFSSLQQNIQAEKAGGGHQGTHACWSKSLALIESSCAKMTVQQKQRLALSLSNCHLEDAARQTFDCPVDIAAGKCAANLFSIILAQGPVCIINTIQRFLSGGPYPEPWSFGSLEGGSAARRSALLICFYSLT